MGLVLAGAVALQFRGVFEAAPVIRKVDLRAALAAEPAGWTIKDLPIGETEDVRAAASSTLRYDDYFFRSYRRGDVEFTVYVAYWLPGKFPPQMIAKHTPDMCWTLNGMTCEEMRHEVVTKVGEATLWPAQWRKFRAPNGAITYTMFWHMIGNRPYDYGNQFYSMPHPTTYWWEALRFATSAKQEQFFFRITCNIPPEQIWEDADVQAALSGFVKLGLTRN